MHKLRKTIALRFIEKDKISRPMAAESSLSGDARPPQSGATEAYAHSAWATMSPGHKASKPPPALSVLLLNTAIDTHKSGVYILRL